MVFLAERGFRVIAADRRGHGQSGQVWHGHNMNTYADDLAQLCQELNLSDAALVGFSMGSGEVARYIGRHGGARVRKVALISAVTPSLLWSPQNAAGLPMEVFNGLRERSVIDRAQLYRDLANGPFFGFNRPAAKMSQGAIDWFWIQAMQAAAKAALEGIRAFSEADFTKDLGYIDVPTLIIHGDDDQIVPIEAVARRSCQLIPNSRLLVYAGAPHGLIETHKARLNADLFDFLSE